MYIHVFYFFFPKLIANGIFLINYYDTVFHLHMQPMTETQKMDTLTSGNSVLHQSYSVLLQ